MFQTNAASEFKTRGLGNDTSMIFLNKSSKKTVKTLKAL